MTELDSHHDSSPAPSSAVLEALAGELRAAIGRHQVRTGDTALSLYRRDASNMEGAAGVVCFPQTTAEVQACVEAAVARSVPFVARGAGTGLAGGAVPLDGSLVISTIKMNRLLSVDVANRRAWVEPGMLNLDLSRAVASHGLHFAPDPSSQQSCSIGGNIANNAGGPHCLADGVTSAHVLALEVVLADGSVAVLGGADPEPVGYDLRGVFVGSEGMFGIATAVLVRLTANAPVTKTVLIDFDTVADGASTVGDILAAGVVPAAVEMMDQLCLRAVEDFICAGLPVEAAAALLVEVTGPEHQVAAEMDLVAALASRRNARSIRLARDDEERALLWKGRKNAFGAVARIKPNYYLHDTVVPRSELARVLAEVTEVAHRHGLLIMNVFHAGDGNLHPILMFDKREAGVMERVHAAGDEIVKISVAAGGVLSGEHGIGLEKRDLMPLMFSPADLAAQEQLRAAFDQQRLANPHKVLPSPATCGDVQTIGEGMWI